jgi:hypothetical protein
MPAVMTSRRVAIHHAPANLSTRSTLCIQDNFAIIGFELRDGASGDSVIGCAVFFREISQVFICLAVRTTVMLFPQ